MNTILLFSLLMLQHVLGDFFFQTNAMVSGKRLLHGWAEPLLAHATVHGSLMFFVLVFFVSPEWAIGLAALDVIAHFCIDRIKCSPNMLGVYNDPNTDIFWMIMGLDQLAHFMTYMLILAIIAYFNLWKF
jgi:hypothetical protein